MYCNLSVLKYFEKKLQICLFACMQVYNDNKVQGYEPILKFLQGNILCNEGRGKKEERGKGKRRKLH